MATKRNLLVIKSIAPYLWRYKYRVTFALGFLLLAKLANVSVPLLLKEVVDQLSPEKQLIMLPLALLIAYGLLRLSAVLFTELRDVVFVKVTRRATRQIALKVFKYLHDLSLSFHLKRQTGGISREIERGTRGISILLTYSLFSIIPVIFEFILVALILLNKFDWRFAVITFSAVITYLVYTFFVSEWRMNIRKIANEWDTQSNSHAVDSLLNYETVKYFNNESFETKRYDAYLQKFERADVKTETSLGFLNIGQSVIIAFAVTALMIMTAQGVVDNEMSIGDLVLVNGLLIQLYIPLNFMGMVYREIKQAFIDMDKMFSLLEEKPEVEDALDAVELKSRSISIEFRDVSFSYNGKHEVLRNINFRAFPNETLAIVGSSGSGKTTIARLLYRFYDVQSGSILVNGIDIRNLNQASYRALVGVVPQDTVLFNDSVGFNIRYGRANCSEEELREVVNLANLKEFIERLPKGYDTEVGERGLKISGGEKQRISIARAMLKNPAVLIFDEATSSLDSQSERFIQTAIERFKKEKTSIIIAHRLSTIINADQIIVLDNGQVVEQGNHQELILKRGKYFAMWDAQQLEES